MPLRKTLPLLTLWVAPTINAIQFLVRAISWCPRPQSTSALQHGAGTE
jgi:hypothetical protein